MTWKTRGRRLVSATFSSARCLLALYLCSHLAGCSGIRFSPSPEPQAGLTHYQFPALVPVPGGSLGAIVNPMGGNLFVPRLDSTVPTTLGYNEDIFGSYNSATGEWRFNFEASFDGSTFVDLTSAVHEELDSRPDETAIPGTGWVKVDSATMQSDGGLQYVFGPDGSLVEKHGRHQACPRILYQRSDDQLLIKQVGCSPRSGEQNEVLLYSLTYEASRVRSLTDRAGHTTSYEYDSAGRLTRVRNAEDASRNRPGVRYEYQAFTGRLTAITNSEGERVEYTYYSPTPYSDERLRLVTQIGEGNPQYRFSYYGEVAPGSYQTLLLDPMGEITRFYFDDQRRISEVEFDAVQERERLAYDAESGSELRPACYIAANQQATFLTYEADDITTVIEPSGNVTTLTYAREANNHSAQFFTPLSTIEDSVGLVTSREYLLPYFQLAEIRNGEGEVTVFTWGSGTEFTQLQSITSPSGIVQHFLEHDLLGQPTRISHGTEGGLVTTRIFDTVGNITQGSLGPYPVSGGVTGRLYDASRNPSVVLLAGQDDLGNPGAESAISITYRSDGQVLCVDRAPAGLGEGPDHCFAYDDLGRPESRSEFVDGQWQREFYSYDLAGRRVSSERANGMRVEREFDQRGRLIAKRSLRNRTLEAEIRYVYGNGSLLATTDSAIGGTEYYTRDFAGRVEAIAYPGGESISFEYDLRSRVTSETYHGSDSSQLKEIGYEYDLANRKVRTFDDGELVLEYTIDNGQVVGVRTGNNLERSFLYDSAIGFKLESLTRDLNSGGEVIENTLYSQEITSDPAAWKIRSNTTVTGVDGGHSESWQTTEIYELGPVSDPDVPESFIGKRILSSDDGHREHRYAWDEFSNRVDDAVETFDYNAETNRLVGANVQTTDGRDVALTYGYDAAGFATERNGSSLDWNGMGLPTEIDSATFEWDMSGRLRSSNDGTIRRDWSRWGGRVEVDAEGNPETLDLGPVILGFGQAADRRYRHADSRGNVQFVSNGAGEIVTLIEYTAFGVGSVHGADSAVDFAARPSLGGGLMLVGGRVLDTMVGRFLSPDPVFSLANQYSYTLGNPIWFNDRSGRHQEVSNDISPAAEYAIVVAVSAGGFVTAIFGFGFALVGTGSAAAFYVASAGLAFGTVGFIATITGAGSGYIAAKNGASGECECTKQVEFGSGERSGEAVGELDESTRPAGANAAGSGVGGAGAMNIGGASPGAGIGGGGGGCGLLGFEVLPALYLAYRRRRRIR